MLSVSSSLDFVPGVSLSTWAVQWQPDLYDQSVEIRFDKLRVENRAMIQNNFLCKNVFAKLCSLVFVI